METTKKAKTGKKKASRTSKKTSKASREKKRTTSPRTGDETKPRRKSASKKRQPKKAASKKETSVNGSDDSSSALFSPVVARRTRAERARTEIDLAEIDTVCSAWMDIVAERITADQTFADIVESFDVNQPRDLRGLFLWDALHAAEAHVSMINRVLATHIRNRQADPLAILADLRGRRLQVAAVYSVNAFLGVLNQMRPGKPKWFLTEEIDPRFAVLALAHQTLTYATEALHVECPPDLTEYIIQATQEEAVWVWHRMPEPGTDTLAACAATAAFFRLMGSEELVTTDEVAAHYAERRRSHSS